MTDLAVLAERILGAIEEAERAARLADRFHPGPWRLDPEVETTMDVGRWVADAKDDGVLVANGDSAAKFFVHEQPQAVLRRCDADRRIVRHVQGVEALVGDQDMHVSPAVLTALRPVLTRLAEAYGIDPDAADELPPSKCPCIRWAGDARTHHVGTRHHPACDGRGAHGEPVDQVETDADGWCVCATHQRVKQVFGQAHGER